MQNIAVVNACSRELIVKALPLRVSAWSKQWFAEQPNIEVHFNDNLFLHTPILEHDETFCIADGRLIVHQAQAVLKNLAAAALNIPAAQQQAKDKMYWEELTQTMLSSLLVELNAKHVQQKALNSNSAVTVIIKFKQTDLILGLDLQALAVLGLYRQSFEVQSLQEKLTGRQDLVMQQSIALRAFMHQIRLPLADVLELKSGDVIRLEHKLEQPLILQAPDSKMSVSSFLVKQGEHKAIVLTK